MLAFFSQEPYHRPCTSAIWVLLLIFGVPISLHLITTQPQCKRNALMKHS